MSREIRRVPINWDHPKKDGHYIPMSNYDFEERYKEYEQELEEWNKDGCPEDEEPYRPFKEDYMPSTGEWFQMYEGVSEGTPLTPPFPTKKEIVEYLIEHGDFWGNKWSREGAEVFVKSEYAPSGIMVLGRVYKPEEQYLI